MRVKHWIYRDFVYDGSENRQILFDCLEYMKCFKGSERKKRLNGLLSAVPLLCCTVGERVERNVEGRMHHYWRRAMRFGGSHLVKRNRKNPLIIEKGNIVDTIYRFPTHQTFSVQAINWQLAMFLL